MNIILRRTLAKQELAERTPKRIETSSICSSDLLPKHELINWILTDLQYYGTNSLKLFLLALKRPQEKKKVLWFVQLINMFTYPKKSLFYERMQSNTNLAQSDKRKLLFFSRFSQFKNGMGCLLPITFPVWMLFKMNLKYFYMKCKASNSPLGPWTFMQCRWVENDTFWKLKSALNVILHSTWNILIHYNSIKGNKDTTCLILKACKKVRWKLKAKHL